MSSLVGLLNGIVDYAGLFPPAALDMDRVVSNYGEYQQVSQSWMLGRLVVPALKLDAFEASASTFLPTEGNPWRISALVPGCDDSEKLESAVQAIEFFNGKHADAAAGLCLVDAIETKATEASDVAVISDRVPNGIDIFFELPHADDPAALIQAIATHPRNSFAKIRTGGVKPEMIPSSDLVARFIKRCVESDLGLKATAGLHHPVRSEFPLTYEADAACATMHGFINVFVSICMAFEHQLGTKMIAEILEETSPAFFVFGDQSIRWKDLEVPVESVDKVRRERAISFGSCSFVEPIQDLQQLGFGGSLAEVV